MPLVCLFVLITLTSLPASSAPVGDDTTCGGCNIFRRDVDISRSANSMPAAVRGTVFNGGRVPVHDAAERTVSDPFGSPSLRLVPTNPGPTVSVKRLSHKPPKAAKKAFEKSVRLSEEGDSAGAIALLHEAIKIDPEYIEALNNLGARYVVIGKYSEAIPFLSKAIEMDPHSMQPYCNLSLAYLGSGDAVAAERAARRAVDNDTTDSRPRYLLGISLVAQRKLTNETRESLQRVQADYPQARIALGMAEAAAGQTAEAKVTLKGYLKLNQPYKRDAVKQLLASLEARERAEGK